MCVGLFKYKISSVTHLHIILPYLFKESVLGKWSHLYALSGACKGASCCIDGRVCIYNYIIAMTLLSICIWLNSC